MAACASIQEAEEALGSIEEADLMKKRFLMYSAFALGVACMFPGVGFAQNRSGDIPGPIDSIQDLQDTAKMLFKMADTNNDGLISQKEALDVGNLLVGGFFFRADVNGDGVLTPEEARQAREALFNQQPLLRFVVQRVKATNPPQGTTTINPSGDTARSLAANPARTIGTLLDTNHDQKIEASELRQAVQTGVQTLFAMADTNQDGQLSPAELNRVVGEAARTAVQAAFQTADTDRNGALSVAEFDKALTEPAHAVFRVLDANGDNQLSIDELQRAQQIIADQIRRLRSPESANSLPRPSQSGASGIGQPVQVTPSPSAITAPAPAPAPAPQP
jgi:Ca2+-binding EF-hand superfamily protein